MVTVNLSDRQSATYAGAVRGCAKAEARLLAARAGRRFAQIVDADGKVRDVVYVDDTRKETRS